VRFDKSRSLRVLRGSIGMLAAIDLDDEVCAVACKAHLPTKMSCFDRETMT